MLRRLRSAVARLFDHQLFFLDFVRNAVFFKRFANALVGLGKEILACEHSAREYEENGERTPP